MIGGVTIWKITCTGGLSRLSGLPHLPRVPCLHVNRPLQLGNWHGLVSFFRWQLFKHRGWIHSVGVQQLGHDWQGSIVFQVVKDVASIPTVEILNLLSLTTNCVRVSGYLSSFVARAYEGLCHAFLQSYAKSSGTTIFKTRCPWRHSTQYCGKYAWS